MQIKTLVSKFVESNSYIIIENETVLIIDPSVEVEVIKKHIGDKKVAGVLLTHGHADHIAYLKDYLNEYNCLIYCHKNARRKIEDANLNHSKYTSSSIAYHFQTEQYKFVSEGNEYKIQDISFKVLETPGHSDCSICFIIEEAMFSGDTLFKSSIGRTDLYSGDSYIMHESLKKINRIEEDYFVYPGHDENTTLSFEKTNNVYLRRAKS